MCHIPKAAEFCICCENNGSHNIVSEYRKLISLISSILNVASCRTMCFICKRGTDKFCCLRNFIFSQQDKDICAVCTGQAQNRAKAVEGNRQQDLHFQLAAQPAGIRVSSLLRALFLAPWLLNSWLHGSLAAKGGLEVVATSLNSSWG